MRTDACKLQCAMATKRKTDESPKTTAKKKKGSCDKEEDQEQDEEGSGEREKLRFLLVGKTGSGKSSSGNTILGQPIFSTDAGFSSVTDQCQLRSQVRFGASIDILDSPGLFDTSRTPEEVSTLLMQAIACMHPGPDAIFYVLKIGRYSKEEFDTYNRLKALLDEDVTKHMIIVFTHGDGLKGQCVEDMLKTATDNLTQVLEDCERRYVVFDNTLADPEPQVRNLLEAVRKLKEKNDNVPYACPKYASVAERFEEELNRRLAEVEKKELQNSKYVEQLGTQLEDAEKKARLEKKKFDKKDRQRQQEMEKKRREVDTRCKDLTTALNQQRLSEKQRTKRLDELVDTLRREREDFEARMERERQRHAEDMRRQEEERERQMRALQAEREEYERREKERRAEMERKLKDEISRAKKKRKRCVVM